MDWFLVLKKRDITFSVSWTLYALLAWGGKHVSASLTTITTTGGIEYLISNYAISGDSASIECSNQSVQLGVFTSNSDFQDFEDYLQSSGIYNSLELWIDLTEDSGKYYFTGGEEVSPAYWSPGEPNQNCTICCYSIDYSPSNGRFTLEDGICNGRTKNILCRVTSINTTTLSTTTAIMTTTTMPLTTSIIMSTLMTTTTSPLIATTMTVAPLQTTPATELSTGEQMTVMYLALIVGGSLAISCLCSSCWLVINRYRRRRKRKESEKAESEKQFEKRDIDDTLSDIDEDEL